MGYSSLAACAADLESRGFLRRIDVEVDPDLEIAAIQRRLYQKGGPAVLFTRVKGTAFPCLANLYGTRERVHYLFRDALENLQGLFGLAGDPARIMRRPFHGARLAARLWQAWPRQVARGPVSQARTTVSALPQIKSWPKDGGAYITLPQVYSEHPESPGWMRSNLGMYRVQLSSGFHAPDEEIGLHYQIHRGIGVHHEAALRLQKPLRVSIFVGGPPAHALAAVMPLPEGVPEIAFGGLLARRRFRYFRENGYFLSADADFCVVGTLDSGKLLPEGPFGDHLGYYSLAHDFPVLRVEAVYHRRDAIWPFTVVGRPPQEDSHFAEVIHELTRDTVSMVVPGIRAVHAVEASGVHPLLLAIGSERYVPYGDRLPRELLTQAHALLGFGQLSLAKFLFLSAWQDDPEMNIRDVAACLRHMLLRFRPEEDLHFSTRTTMDTLDYSGHGLNQGSKVAVVSAGKSRRELAWELPPGLAEALPNDFKVLRLALPGILVLQAPRRDSDSLLQGDLDRLIHEAESWVSGSPRRGDVRRKYDRNQADALWMNADGNRRRALQGLPLWVLADDADFCARTLDNFLWVAFTRCDPATDTDGIAAFSQSKHWGCLGPWILDSRIKIRHAPVLEEDPSVEKRLDLLASRGGPLHGLI